MSKRLLVIMVSLVLLATGGLAFAGGQKEGSSGAATQSTATSTPTTSNSQAARPVSFEFWETDTQTDRVSTYQLLISTFEAEHPNVTVKIVPIEENDVPTQIQAASAAGTLPALLYGPAEDAVTFGSRGLTDNAAATKVINDIGMSNFYPGTLAVNQSAQSGSYYALPFTGWIEGIWYRTDWFQKAGLNPPKTWEDMLKASQTFYKPDQNQYGILVGTKPEVYTEQCFTPIAASNGAGLFANDGSLNFNTPAMKQAIEFYAQLAKYNPPGPQNWRARDYYLQGKMAGFFYSTFIMDDLAIQKVAQGSLTGDNFANLKGSQFDPQLVEHTGFVPIITHKQDAGYGVIVDMMMFKQKDPAVTQAAGDLVKYLFTPHAYITWLHVAPGGNNPVIHGIADNSEFLNDPEGVFQHYGKDKMDTIISGMNSITDFSIVGGKVVPAGAAIYSKAIIPQMIYKITQESMPVDQAMTWAEGQMKDVMSQMK
ncbi:MAG TPA: extracellular solute-binding protein [Spirochaetia bacterium]|nr:extracellular solute-binding protein [Spirochaetia bacterium]